MAEKLKGKVKSKVTTTKGGNKAIKPNMGRGTGGILMTSVKMKVEKDKKGK